MDKYDASDLVNAIPAVTGIYAMATATNSVSVYLSEGVHLGEIMVDETTTPERIADAIRSLFTRYQAAEAAQMELVLAPDLPTIIFDFGGLNNGKDRRDRQLRWGLP